METEQERRTFSELTVLVETFERFVRKEMMESENRDAQLEWWRSFVARATLTEAQHSMHTAIVSVMELTRIDSKNPQLC